MFYKRRAGGGINHLLQCASEHCACTRVKLYDKHLLLHHAFNCVAVRYCDLGRSPDEPYNFFREFDLPLTTNTALMLALTVNRGCPLFEKSCDFNNLFLAQHLQYLLWPGI